MSDSKLSWHLATLAAVMASDLDPTARHVLHTLAFHADWTTGERIHPSIARLAAATGYSERCVFKTLASLEERGWVTRETVRGRPSNYHITPPDPLAPPPLNVVHPCTTFTPEPDAPLNHVHPTPEPRSPLPLNHVQGPLNHVHPTPEPRSGAPEPRSPNHTIIRPSTDPLPSQECVPVIGARVCEGGQASAGGGEGVADMIPELDIDRAVMDLFHSQSRILGTKRYHDVAAAFRSHAEPPLAMRALAMGLERLQGHVSADGAATIAIRCAASWVTQQKVRDELERDPTPPKPLRSREEIMRELEARNLIARRDEDAIADAARAARYKHMPSLPMTPPQDTTPITHDATTTQGAAR